MLLKYIIALALVSFTFGMGYTELITDLTNDSTSFTSTPGSFNFKISQLIDIKKRNGYSITEALSNLPDLDFYSYDNSKVLESLKKAANEAYLAGRYGDFFYLWTVMHHNGHPLQVNNPGTLSREVSRRLGNVAGITEVLANTLTNARIAEMYRAVEQRVFSNEIFKRDMTICSNSNLPKVEDCNRLMFDLRKGLSHPNDPVKCYYTCCAAWSARIFVSTAWAKGKVQWCQEHCIQNGYSCKINDVILHGRRLNFCTSSVSTCD